MIWETFSTAHIATLILGLATIIIIYNVLVKRSRKAQILTLFTISLACAVVVIVQMFKSDDITKSLPIELWSLSALLLPFAVITRQKWCCNLLLLWPIQSLNLLVFNGEMAHLDIFSSEFALYFFTHLLIFAIPLIMFWLKLVNRDYKYIKLSLIITALTYTAVHFVNIALGTNYLYSMGVKNSNFLWFFYTFGGDYWYMYLLLPIFLIYLSWWYLPELLDHRRKTKRLRGKLKDIDEYFDEYYDEYMDEIIEERFGK